MGSYILWRGVAGIWLEGLRGILLPGGEAEGGDVKNFSLRWCWMAEGKAPFREML